jgi:hypothetical protein
MLSDERTTKYGQFGPLEMEVCSWEKTIRLHTPACRSKKPRQMCFIKATSSSGNSLSSLIGVRAFLKSPEKAHALCPSAKGS